MSSYGVPCPETGDRGKMPMKKSILAAIISLAAVPALATDYYDQADGTVKSGPDATTLTDQTALSKIAGTVPV